MATMVTTIAVNYLAISRAVVVAIHYLPAISRAVNFTVTYRMVNFTVNYRSAVLTIYDRLINLAVHHRAAICRSVIACPHVHARRVHTYVETYLRVSCGYRAGG
ncbi:hypothetical protein GCM10028827_32390 [Mucilaginibacter myungsuensis]